MLKTLPNPFLDVQANEYGYEEKWDCKKW
jgi:hypothetical protein